LRDWSKARPDVAMILDYLWLVQIEQAILVPDQYHVHAKRIIELANRRRLIDLGARIANNAADTTVTVESTVAMAISSSKECAS
jgi:replicative DNA helicase